MKNKKEFLYFLLFILLFILTIIAIYHKYNKKDNYEESKMNVVTSLEDKISNNTVWCGTFNLIWNDLKNDIVKQDIVFSNQTEVVDNLNLGTFNTNYLSSDSYYKKYGKPTKSLKKEIEKNIKEKFNEESDILNDFKWDGNDLNYFLYVMLKKNFEFPKEFTELNNDTFNGVGDYKYFGINNKTDKLVKSQAKVMYYNSDTDFAVKLLTKGKDEVILTRGNKENNFKELFESVISSSREETNLESNDTLKIPNIKFKHKQEFKNLENQDFMFEDGKSYKIDKAIQTIEFELDKKGGKLKSEAGMDVDYNSAVISKSRHFNLDNTFTIFLLEKNKQYPYFAAKISEL